METKNIINIPEGFEIDKEQSTERQIVLKKIKQQIVSKKIGRPRTWEEYCEKMKGKDSYFFNETLQEVRCSNFGETGVFVSVSRRMRIAYLLGNTVGPFRRYEAG